MMERFFVVLTIQVRLTVPMRLEILVLLEFHKEAMFNLINPPATRVSLQIRRKNPSQFARQIKS